MPVCYYLWNGHAAEPEGGAYGGEATPGGSRCSSSVPIDGVDPCLSTACLNDLILEYHGGTDNRLLAEPMQAKMASSRLHSRSGTCTKIINAE